MSCFICFFSALTSLSTANAANLSQLAPKKAILQTLLFYVAQPLATAARVKPMHGNLYPREQELFLNAWEPFPRNIFFSEIFGFEKMV